MPDEKIQKPICGAAVMPKASLLDDDEIEAMLAKKKKAEDESLGWQR